MSGYSAFTFVSAFFIMGLVGFVYIIVRPFFNMFVIWGVSLAPSLSGMFEFIQTCYTYMPLGLIIGVIIYFITNSQSMD